MAFKPLAEQTRSGLELASSEKKPARIFVLTFCNGVLDALKAELDRERGRAYAKGVVSGSGLRVEQRVERAIERRRTFEGLAIQQEVTIQVDIVFIRTPEPCHSIGIQHVGYNERPVGARRRWRVEERELYCRPRESLDAVKPGRMQKNAARFCRPEPCDFDRERFTARAFRRKAERVKSGPRACCSVSEALACSSKIG